MKTLPAHPPVDDVQSSSMGRVFAGIINLVCTVLGVTVAFSTSLEFQEALRDILGVDGRVALGVLMGGTGYLLGATFSFELNRWLEEALPNIQLRDVVWGGVGCLAGMLGANLLLLPLVFMLNIDSVHSALAATAMGRLAMPVALILLPLSLNLVAAYLGATTLLRKQEELGALLLGVQGAQALQLPANRRFLLDTSCLIDGRVLDLLQLHVLQGQIVVPKFVVSELQLLADSSDDTKRPRGRRGLEILEQIRAEARSALMLPEMDFDDTNQVDEKLVRYARAEPAVLVTNDYNLAKVAGLEGIETVSLHSIADAMRPVALPGEALELEIVKKGKEKGQGIGYLNDGTMVVVRDGAAMVGERSEVLVEKVLQTSAGRMIFSRPKQAS